MLLRSVRDLGEQVPRNSMPSCTGRVTCCSWLSEWEGCLHRTWSTTAGGGRGVPRFTCMAACLYLIPCRTDLVEILDTFQYNDSLNDIFEREPFSVLIRSKEAGRGTYLHPAGFS